MWKMYSHLKTQENKIIESVETPVTNKWETYINK
jgi:hypothetical protein